MASFVDEAIETFKQTLNLRLFAYFLAIQLLESVAFIVITIAFALIGIAAILLYIVENFGELSAEAILAAFSSQVMLFPILAMAIPLAIIWLLVLAYIAALFSGARIIFFNNFANGEGPSLGKAFGLARKRAFTFFKLELIVSIVVLAIISIILAITLLPMIGAIGSSASMAGSGSMAATAIFGVLAGLLLVFIFFIALFFLSPFLWLFLPVVFFEKKGVVGSISRSVELVKPKYWDNLGFIVIFIAIMFVINLIINAITRLISLAFFLPLIGAAETMTGEAALYSMLGELEPMPAIMAIFAIIYLPFTVWMNSYSTAAARNLYFLDQPAAQAEQKNKKRIK